MKTTSTVIAAALRILAKNLSDEVAVTKSALNEAADRMDATDKHLKNYKKLHNAVKKMLTLRHKEGFIATHHPHVDALQQVFDSIDKTLFNDIKIK
jgi:predicted ArsR family transcriptional regulator